MPGELDRQGKSRGLEADPSCPCPGSCRPRSDDPACDADPRLTDPLRALCAEKAIPCDSSMTLRQLGTACGIAVPAAAVAVLNG